MEKLKLGVIFGGMSTEHEVSIVSGTSVIKNLNKEKYEIIPIYLSKEGNWFYYDKKVENIEILQVGDKIKEVKPIENPIQLLKSLDIAFPVLHGLYGEDGTIQGLLELLKVKYVGCRVLSSSVCMDKVYAKIIFEKAKLTQASYIYIKVHNVNYTYVNHELNQEEMNLDQIAQKVEQNLGFPVFVKPTNSGSSVGIS